MIKRNKTGKKILFYFLGYTNEILLPNSDLALYNSPSLTFTLNEREGGRRSFVSCRNPQWREQEEQAAQAARAAQLAPSAQPAQHTPPPSMPGMGWTPAIPAPRFTPGFGYGMGYVPRKAWHTEAQAQPSQRHMGQGGPGITSQDTPQIPRECHPLFALRSHWTSSTLAWEDWSSRTGRSKVR